MSSNADKHRKEEEQRKYLVTIESLVRLPYNRVCADCPAKVPQWVTITFGAFICVRCAAIHRQLGTHITRVKSLSQDYFTEETVEMMKQYGNERVNKLLEHKVPRIDRTNDSNMVQFIRDKYEKKRFANKAEDLSFTLTPRKNSGSRRDEKDRTSHSSSSKSGERAPKEKHAHHTHVHSKPAVQESPDLLIELTPSVSELKVTPTTSTAPTFTPQFTTQFTDPSKDLFAKTPASSAASSAAAMEPTHEQKKLSKDEIMQMYTQPVQPTHAYPSYQTPTPGYAHMPGAGPSPGMVYSMQQMPQVSAYPSASMPGMYATGPYAPGMHGVSYPAAIGMGMPMQPSYPYPRQ